MSDFVKNFEKKNKPQIQKYKKYLKDNDWSQEQITRNKEGNIVSSKYYFIKDVKFGKEIMHEGKEPEYKVQDKIVKTVVDRLKYFVENAEADIGKSVRVDRLIKSMRGLIDLHLKRVDGYISSNSILEDKEEVENDDKKTQRDYKSEEIEYDNILYRDQASITDKVKKLNLEREESDSILELYDNVKAPLSMREEIEKHFPDVKRKVESMGLDFKTPPKNEMFIHIENPPEWNEDKHYFEQDKKTLQFYIDEYKKIENGITIDGVYISPWMYCHLNCFVTDVPMPFENKHTGEIESKDITMNPPLRDNEWFIIQDSYEKAKRDGELLFLCATRRAAKTTLIASHMFHKGLSGGKELVVAGGSTKDLGQIEKNFRKTVLSAHPAFKLPNISNDWTKKVKLGIKKKNQKDILQCTLNVVNLNSGGDKASEVLAGFTPDAFVLDECMKSPFIDQLNAAKPAFDSPYGKRCTPILSGTGSSNDALTQDAFMILQDPASEEVSEMNWDALERNVPEDLITWKRRSFGTFLPAQMSAKDGMVKIQTTLAEYLNIENPKDSLNIKINVTDWKHSLKIIKEDRKRKEKNKPSLTKEIVYYPIDPEEIFLSGKPNPFPREELKIYKQRLIAAGDTGKNVVLDYDDVTGDVTYSLSEKELAPYPFRGGFHDAPVTIYEDPLPNAPFEFYLSSLDNYKQEQADSDSVGSFTVIRRDTGRVVATYHSRPDPHSKFHRQGLLLIEMYKAPCFMENADMGFKEYCDRLDRTDDYVLKQVDFLSDMNWNTTDKRKYGWTPTPKNISFLLNMFISIMKQEEEYEDENGKIKTRWGFERIKDIGIIDEMINYKDGDNFDRITSVMGAYGYDYYLTITYGAPKPIKTEEQKRIEAERRERSKKKMGKRGMFPQSRRSMFPNTKGRNF